MRDLAKEYMRSILLFTLDHDQMRKEPFFQPYEYRGAKTYQEYDTRVKSALKRLEELSPKDLRGEPPPDKENKIQKVLDILDDVVHFTLVCNRVGLRHRLPLLLTGGDMLLSHIICSFMGIQHTYNPLINLNSSNYNHGEYLPTYGKDMLYIDTGYTGSIWKVMVQRKRIGQDSRCLLMSESGGFHSQRLYPYCDRDNNKTKQAGRDRLSKKAGAIEGAPRVLRSGTCLPVIELKFTYRYITSIIDALREKRRPGSVQKNRKTTVMIYKGQ